MKKKLDFTSQTDLIPNLLSAFKADFFYMQKGLS